MSFLHYCHSAISNHLSLAMNGWSLKTGLTVDLKKKKKKIDRNYSVSKQCVDSEGSVMSHLDLFVYVSKAVFNHKIR